MKTIILLVIIAIVAADEDYYVLDKIDTNLLMTNVEEMKKFLDCMSDKGPCKKEYLSYKAAAGEAIQQGCRRCSTEQKLFVWLFIDLIKTSFPKHFIDFKNKFDPEHKYFASFEAVIDNFKPS